MFGRIYFMKLQNQVFYYITLKSQHIPNLNSTQLTHNVLIRLC